MWVVIIHDASGNNALDRVIVSGAALEDGSRIEIVNALETDHVMYLVMY